jgi:hypothetical protein
VGTSVLLEICAVHESLFGTFVWTGCVSQESLCVDSGSR